MTGSHLPNDITVRAAVPLKVVNGLDFCEAGAALCQKVFLR